MKKKRNWAAIASVAAGTLAYLKFSKYIPPDVPPDKPDEPTGTAALRYCVNKYGNLTYTEYQLKLFNLDVAFEEGRITREVYDKDRELLLFCRGIQKVYG